jgi:AcrR family transcriptional regulator
MRPQGWAVPTLVDMTPPTTTRERIVAEAVAMATGTGWADVTMAKLADRVGVSRQTVYNEVGGKEQLAEAMILGELERFLSLVTEAFDAHAGDLLGAIRQACTGVLTLAQDNLLLKAVVSATHGADTELLPLLTTHSESLLSAAKVVVRDRVLDYELPMSDDRLDAAIDAVVRVVLSHVMQPSGSPEETAEDIAWIAGRVLR